MARLDDAGTQVQQIWHRLMRKVRSQADFSVGNDASLAGGLGERKANIPCLLQFWSIVTESICCLSDKKGDFEMTIPCGKKGNVATLVYITLIPSCSSRLWDTRGWLNVFNVTTALSSRWRIMENGLKYHLVHSLRRVA